MLPKDLASKFSYADESVEDNEIISGGSIEKEQLFCPRCGK
jgi:hypothetical protein